MLSDLSIVIPVYRDGPALETLLRELTQAISEGAEVIVVGTNDDPDSRTLALQHGVRYVESAKGRGVQLAAGAAAARGNALWFIHADSRLPEGAAVSVLDVLASQTWGRFDIRFDCGTWRLGLVARLMNLRSRASGIATGDQAVFVRVECYRAVGGFPQSPLMEDIALSTALKRAFGRPARAPGVIVTSSRKWHREGIMRTIVSMWRWRYRYWRGERPERLAQEYYRE